MFSLWNFQWLWLFVVGQLNIRCVETIWPSSPSSNIQLLGLFYNISNLTTSDILWSQQTNAMFMSALLLSQQYNITIGEQFIGWKSVQNGGEVMNAISDACRLMPDSNIIGIVGPVFSREAQFISPFAAKVGIPVISYAATNPQLSDRNANPTFYRTVPSDNEAALAIVKLFIQFNWTSCIIIHQNDAYGSGGAKIITNTFSKNNLTVVDTIVFNIATSTFLSDFKWILTHSSTRIIILWASSTYTSLILQNALDSDVLGPQFTWILSSDVPLSNFNRKYYGKLSGLLTIEPVVGNVVNASINNTLLNDAYNIWQKYEPESYPGSDKVDYYALFAFDATWLLIQSLIKLCSINNKNISSCISFINTSFCFDRYFINSTSLINIINNIEFLGVSGLIQFNLNTTDRINGNYYIIKNIQYSSNRLNNVPVLIWSNSNDWTSYPQTNVIIWPGNSLKPPASYAIMSGITLNIGVMEALPFTIVTNVTDKFGNETTKLTGYMPDLIELLRNKMGFIPNIILISKNETYSNVIDAVANGVYDMVVADMTITAERREKVAFSSSIFDNSLRVVVRNTATIGVDFFAFLNVFTFKLWITALCVSIYAGFLIALIEREKNEELQERSIISLIAMSMWFSLGAILGRSVDFHVTTAAGRLLTVGLYILSIILVAAYTARLTSDLTISKSQNIISGIDDIKNEKLEFHRIGILTGSAIEYYYLRAISNGTKNFYSLNSQQEMYDKLLNNVIDASIMDTRLVEYSINNKYCNLTLVGADFDKSAYGIVFQKQWSYQETLDINILLLRESGALDELLKKWFKGNYCSDISSTSKTMTIESMAGLFLTFGVIGFLAVLLFLWRKRFILKDYLLSFVLRKNLLSQQNVSSFEQSIKTSESLSLPSVTKRTVTYF